MTQNETTARLGKERSRRRRRGIADTSSPTNSLVKRRIIGHGRGFDALDSAGITTIHEAALTLLAKTGLSDPSTNAIDLVIAAGGHLDEQNRLRLPETIVTAAINGLTRDITLYGRGGDTNLELTPDNVFVGTGGASPLVYDQQLKKYRESKLVDLYDAARLVDKLDHIHFFSRPLVARDMSNARDLDINTAYASLAGTRKHAFVSATSPSAVRDIAQICYQLAGSKEDFCARPFLSINVNHAGTATSFRRRSTGRDDRGCAMWHPSHGKYIRSARRLQPSYDCRLPCANNCGNTCWDGDRLAC